jgi:uncharacterized RDD family membrane protein YckC
VTPGPPYDTSYPIAQLERRFTAFAVDRLLAWSLLAVIGVVTAVAVSDDVWTVVGSVAGGAVLLWLAFSVALGVTGSSPGKAMTGLRVVHHGTGTPIGVGRALLRSLVLGIAGLPTFGLGLATLAWTAVEDRGRQRRGWHDHLAHTVVADVRPVEEVAEEVDEGPRHIVNLTAMRLVPAPPVEVVRTPERSEQSMRRQQLPPEVTQPPPATLPPTPAFAPAQHRAPAHHQAPAQHRSPAQQAPPLPAQQAPQQAPPQQPVAPQRPQPVQPVQPVPQPQSGQRWRVHFDNGESFVIAGLALVGRRPEARNGEVVAHLIPLQSADMSVSKTHAQFGPAPDGTIVVMDRGSTNGTVLVRQGVSRQLSPGRPAALLHGDKVVYGDREMVVTREA